MASMTTPEETANTRTSKIRPPKSATITKIFYVPLEKRRYKGRDHVKVCMGIMKRTGAQLELSVAKDQSLAIVVTGNVDAVMKADKEIFSLLQIQDSETLEIPKERHRFIIGKNGKKRQELALKTATTIQIPGPEDPSNQIKISGTKEGIEKAKHEILLISAEQDKHAVWRVNIDKVYHPFITGAHNKVVGELMQDTGACIHVPPPPVNKTEIVVSGTRQQVALAIAKIQEIFEDKKKNTTTIAVEVKKSQHKFVIGSKGKTLQEILAKTGVSVEVPPFDSGSETVILRGEPGHLVQALTAVYVKIQECLPAANSKSEKSVIMGHKANQKELALRKLTITVDPKYHPRIIGRKGETIKAICSEHGVNIRFPERKAENQDQITVTGDETKAAAARDAIQAIVDELEDTISKDITLDSRVHARIIGARGIGIISIQNEFKVDIRFPRRGAADPDLVTVTGRSKLVNEAIDHLLNLEDKYMEDVELKKYLKPFMYSAAARHEQRGSSNGVVVRETQKTTANQKAPDMSCTEEFPSLGASAATNTSPLGPKH